MPTPVEGDRQALLPTAPIPSDEVLRVLVAGCSSPAQVAVAATLTAHPESAYSTKELAQSIGHQEPQRWRPTQSTVAICVSSLVTAGLVAKQAERRPTDPILYAAANDNPGNELAVLGVPLDRAAKDGRLPVWRIFAEPRRFEPEYAAELRYAILDVLTRQPEGGTMTYDGVVAAIGSPALTEWHFGIVPSVDRLAASNFVEARYTGYGSSTVRLSERYGPEVRSLVNDITMLSASRQTAQRSFRRAAAIIESPRRMSAVMATARAAGSPANRESFYWSTNEHILHITGRLGEITLNSLGHQLTQESRPVGRSVLASYLRELTSRGQLAIAAAGSQQPVYSLAPEQTT